MVKLQFSSGFLLIVFIALSGWTHAQSTSSSYPFPGQGLDLQPGVYWYRHKKKHGAGTQSLGYDLTAIRFDEAKKCWTNTKPGFDSDDTNESALIYGIPAYAIADGEVIRCWRNAPENPRPGERHPKSDKIPEGGNVLIVKSENGENIMYAHFQPGTISSSVCPIEKRFWEDRSEADLPPSKRPKVKKGQFIGRIGNSGQSGGPHLHIHVSKEKEAVSLPFHGVWVKPVEKNEDLPADWALLDGKPLPPGPVAILPGFIYVNSTYEGKNEKGTIFEPFRTVSTANEIAWEDAQILIAKGSYPEMLTFSKPARVLAKRGLVRIGQR